MWQQLKREKGPDWYQAVHVDHKIRDARPPYKLFVHPARVPLEQAVKIPEDYGYKQDEIPLHQYPEMSPDNPLFQQCDSGFCFL